MEPQKVIEAETVFYYGKKQYKISSFIARKKISDEKVPDYKFG